MSDAAKGNAEILANHQAFRESLARAREAFAKIEGVVGVGFGQKETAGSYRENIAIVVFVREKKKEADLSPEQRIPPQFEGYLTDVRVVHKAAFQACDNTATYNVIRGGIQITPPMNSTNGQFHSGTLGAIVKKRNDSSRENIYLLTNKHVLFIDEGKDSEYIYHPFCPSPANKKFAAPGDSNALGPIQPEAFITNMDYIVPGDSSPTKFYIDCAIARIDIDSKCLGTTCTKDQIKTAQEIIDLELNGVNTIHSVRSVIGDPSIINQTVYKVGRTTGKTAGIVRLIDATVTVPPDPAVPGSTSFDGLNTIQIDFDTTSGSVNCKGNARFTEEGDSGSLVLDAQGNVIGLHSLGAPPGSPSAFPSNACHIIPVLDKLNLCIPVTSETTHGCCGATDGSGSDPAQMGDFPLLDGTIDFAAGSVAQDLALVAPPNDAEMAHLTDLLADLRTTRLGREMHAIFAQIRREIGYLVRNCRPVKVVWGRNKGPAYFAHMLNHLKGTTPAVPREVNGISRDVFYKKMVEVLAVHGSIPLRRAIQEHADTLGALIAEYDSAEECIVWLREQETR